jgi:hypothetical protein
MFVQVIQGQLADKDKLRAAIDRWQAELAPGAEGWLGSTAGVTEDGRAIAIVRFESEQAAQRNNDRPEQGQWWAETQGAFSGPVTFRNSTFVDVDNRDRDRDPGSAGFVQVMQGQGTDTDRAREIMSHNGDAFAQWRPDVIASLVAGHDDGGFTMVSYFTSEEAAREGERKQPPPELAATMEELGSLMSGEPTFYDLTEPWFGSPAGG